MLFCSLQFCLFFTIVFAAYWALPWAKVRVWVLLAASFYFYASWNRWLALILCLSTCIDYLLARGMEKWQSPHLRKLLLLLSIVGNVGLLSYFKYANFFLRSLEESAGVFGLTIALPFLRVILPVGISFYTFEAINYTVDVYRRKIPAQRNLAHFMLFILFFPHLVAGPIVRAKDFLPQINRRKHWSWFRANAGVLLILMGVVKKLAIADRMALYVDPVFADPGDFGSLALWQATVAYAIQVYCDFSGYSDMAMGLAYLFGYHLAVNFNMPFLSANFAEFWRRWHISLSSWIRDYLFFPLGGSLGSLWQTCRNILITMSLCGLWHGASWNFVLWGFFSGVLLFLHSLFQAWCQHRPGLSAVLQTPGGTALRIAITFASFCLTLAVFRSQGLTAASAMVGRMLVPSSGASMTLQVHGLYLTLLFVIVCHWLGHKDRWLSIWNRVPLAVRGFAAGTALTIAILLAPNSSKAFIYFQF